MKGGHLAPAQNCAKTKNQLAHDSEARALPLQSVDYLRLLASQLGTYLAQPVLTVRYSVNGILPLSCVDPNNAAIS
jgi:hypothetical protein